MARAGLDTEAVFKAAMMIADSEGLPSLTIARLALSLRVKGPSLYNHIQGLDMIKDELTRQGIVLLIVRTREALAGVDRRKALDVLGSVQRQFAKDHPGLWAATQTPVARWSAASHTEANAYISLILGVLRDYGATGDMGIHAARVIRASLKGFIDLELGGGFGYRQDLDLSFDTLLQTLDAGLRLRKRPPLDRGAQPTVKPASFGHASRARKIKQRRNSASKDKRYQ